MAFQYLVSQGKIPAVEMCYLTDCACLDPSDFCGRRFAVHS